MSNTDFDFVPQLVQKSQVNPNATRWLFFAGDVLGKDRKLEMPQLAAGGEEVQAVTLVMTGGFIRRARFTPMIRWYRGEVAEAANTNGRWKPIDEVLPGHAEALPSHHVYGRASSPLVAVEVSPASEIEEIINPARNSARKGILEVKALYDIEPQDFQKTGYQQLFFNSTYNSDRFPVKLRDLRALIESAERRDSDFEDVRATMLASCDQFKVWGEAYLEAQNVLVRMPPREGFTYEYSQVALTLFDQLEYERVDEHLNKAARTNTDIGATLEKLVQLQEIALRGDLKTSNEDVVKMALQQIEEQRKALEAQQAQIATLTEKLTATVTVGQAKPNQQPQQIRK